MRIYCATCTLNFTELPDDAKLSSDFRFTCRECYAPDNRVQGLNVAHDPRLDRAGTPEGAAARRPRPAGILGEVIAHGGFHLDRHAPKPMKPGPTWSNSDSFLYNLVADLGDEERNQALVVMHGRWRRGFTFDELATATGLPVAEVRALLSVLRTQGNAVMEKRQRADAKFWKKAGMSVKAKELFERGLTTRQVAAIMGCSIGYASELRRAA